MAGPTTPEEFRRKAAETFKEARSFTHPDVRAGMLKVAAEYERLALRAEGFDERAHRGASNEQVNWRE